MDIIHMHEFIDIHTYTHMCYKCDLKAFNNVYYSIILMFKRRSKI